MHDFAMQLHHATAETIYPEICRIATIRIKCSGARIEAPVRQSNPQTREEQPTVKTASASGRNRSSAGRANRSALMCRWLIRGLGLATVILLVGCGSASQSPPQRALQSSAETETTPTSRSAEESRSELGGPLADVGTITGSPEKGTTFTDHYRVGPLLYSNEGSPPEEVLAACNITNSTVIASSVFARGQVTIAYQEGTLPTEVVVGSLASVQEVNNRDLGDVVAFSAGGKWSCNSTSFVLHFQPGESQTFPIWIIAAGVLSNA
ncbi:MAG: hypothetical protein ACYDA6_11375, partial [Solirubrobacteraceae bacterium]